MNLLLGVALVLGLMIMIHEWGPFHRGALLWRARGCFLHRIWTATFWMETRRNGLPREARCHLAAMCAWPDRIYPKLIRMTWLPLALRTN